MAIPKPDLPDTLPISAMLKAVKALGLDPGQTVSVRLDVDGAYVEGPGWGHRIKWERTL